MLLRFRRLGIVIACVVLALVALGPTAQFLLEGDLPKTPAGLAYSDMASIRPPPPAQPPDVLVGHSATRLARATPHPSPTPARLHPEWVVSRSDLSFRPRPDAKVPDGGLVPQGSILKVVEAQDDRMRLLYTGDGERYERAEGWVDASEVLPTQAPRWVMSRHGAALLAGMGPGASISAWLLGKTVLEVLEDGGQELRVFHLGDGRARGATEGWVGVLDLVAANPLLAAEGRGVRVLTRSQEAELRSGGGIWLATPYRSQFDGSPAEAANCGPASVGMALDSFGVGVTTTELRAQAMRLQGTSGPDVGVAIEFLEGVVERHGMRGYDLGPGRDSFRRWSLDDVRRHLQMGHPVIPQLRFRQMPGRGASDYYEDHYVVITGVLGEDFIYNDPVDVDGPGYGRLMSAGALTRAWGSSLYPFAAFAVGRP